MENFLKINESEKRLSLNLRNQNIQIKFELFQSYNIFELLSIIKYEH